ncbi:tetratricopeptide repeat protein [Marinirhabdus gelatinilytica]|uniref:Tetratricopeptide repeat protein n=1 Tax=Marinirhabdus gelatinilytica TaxID=1703343 RepID=A0A370QAA2_9FLAO|nr:tetratricopeptide repeat protein [Marinirhabdus gelatinilytica]RDK85293.1 tetratricopeptide repeat protein [Marinirhabdus gelatinilytica]
MKKYVAMAGILLVTAVSFGQKKEIKRADKALKNGDVSEAIGYINEAESSIGSADNDLKVDFYVTKGQVYLADAGDSDTAKMMQSADAFKKAMELDADNKDAKLGVQQLRVALVNSAVSDQRAKNFDSATKKLYTSYTVAGEELDLYNAAESAILGKDYDTALKHYEKLLELGYTGERKEWVATDIETGEVVVFADEATRSTNMLSGKYTNPDERMSASVKGDILKNIALIYTSKGDKEKAKKVMADARKENPEDVSLMRAEADMAYQANDMKTYNAIMDQIIATDPSNPELRYNLGVGFAKNGEEDKAIEQYKKALELDPTYAAAQINIAATLLGKESAIVEEMNNLGTSSADNKRYDELKEERKQLYREVLPYLESAVEQRSENVELVRTLMNIYSQLGEDAKFKEMKAKLQTLEGGK